jgi:pimeloyl-ACP methyl ester carboxylesterase
LSAKAISNTKNGVKLVACLLIALLLTNCSTSPTTQEYEIGPTLQLEPCELSETGGTTSGQRAQCGKLRVYENRTSSTGRQIDLHIVVIPAISRSPEPDPLFILAGGPGEAATQSYPALSIAFSRINQRRDIVLVDQRGTGSSNPLECQSTEEDQAALETDPKALQGLFKRCLDELEADPRFYTTSIAMDDLDEVRQALGYERINLYGVSYGTRAAMVYMRQYPDNIRVAILDGLAPPEWILGPKASQDAQRALDLTFQRCLSDQVCSQAFPNIRSNFEEVMSAVKDDPVELTLPHPVSGEMFDFTLDYNFLATTIHGMSYAPETVALLPLMIHTSASRGDYSNLASVGLTYIYSVSGAISPGMRFSVICAEDVPFYDQEVTSEGYLGDFIVQTFTEICKVWPQGQIPADFHEPVRSEIPVLLLSGELDPVTPPDNAQLASRNLPNSLHLFAPGQSHANIFRGCIPSIATDFIESGSVQDLDITCIQDLEPMPFFVNFSGPIP